MSHLRNLRTLLLRSSQGLRETSLALTDATATGTLHATSTHLPKLPNFAPAATIPASLLRRRFASDAASSGGDANSTKPSGWISGWVKSKIPTALGGTREEISALENLSLDDYAESLKQARRMGSLTGFASGTSAVSNPEAQGTLRLFEGIIAAMTPSEKADLTSFRAVEQARVAAEVGCTTVQVDDCIARYLWMKKMTAKMAELRKEGKPMPRSIDEVESMLGSWKQYKTEHGGSGVGGVAASGAAIEGGSGGAGNAGGAIEVPMDAKGPKGQPCPLAGAAVGRNTKCPATKKAYKACCGRGKR